MKGPPRWAHNQEIGVSKEIKDVLRLAKEGAEKQIAFHKKEISRLTATKNRMTKK